MKKQLVLFLFSIALCGSMQSQTLKTVKHYYGFTDILYEVYTVIEGTGTKHGNYKRYDRNGFLLESATFKKNVLNGQYIKYGGGFFVERGKIASKMNYLNGKEHGEQFYYSGQAAQGEYYLNKKQVFNSGNLVSETLYYENGKKKSYEERGSKGGRQLEWYENGKKKRDVTIFITENGRAYNDTSYFESGEIQGIQVIDDTQSGTVKTFHENGKLQATCQQKNGALDGNMKTYKIDGTLESEVYYLSGTIQNRTIYSSMGKTIEHIKLKNSSSMTYDGNSYDSISGKLISEFEVDYNGFQFQKTNERIYEKDGSVVVKDYLKNTEKRFDSNNVLVFEQNKEGDRMSYEYADLDTIICYWSDNDEYIYKKVMKGETHILNSDGKVQRIKYDNGIEKIYEEDGSIVVKDYSNNTLKTFDINNILVFEQNKEGDRMSYEYADSDTTILYWSDNDEYIYKRRVKGATHFFSSDGKIQRVKYDDGVTATYLNQTNGLIVTLSKGKEIAYKHYDIDRNLLKIKDDENNIIIFNKSGNMQSVAYKITEEFNKLLAEFVVKKESFVNKALYGDDSDNGDLANKILYLESYDDGAVKSIGCFDSTGKNKVEYWYYYDSEGNLTMVEEDGSPLKKIRKSHSEKGNRLLVVIQDVIKSIGDKMFF